MITDNVVLKAVKMFFAAMLAPLSFACSDSKDTPGDESLTAASFRYETVTCNTTVNQLLLSGSNDLEYRAEIVAGTQWCSFANLDSEPQYEKQGAMQPIVFLYTRKNESAQPRTATVTVAFSNGDNYEVSLTQQAYSSSADYDRSWAEQPYYRSGDDNLWHHTHYTTLNGREVRNYSLCFDRQKRAAYWVAYPLHNCYRTPNNGRSNLWGYDPDLDAQYQGYIGQSYGTGHQRGHQLPSADRVATEEMNIQTFYSTNMTPQNGTLNTMYWADLEGKVRSNIKADTLYVVTGAHFDSSSTISDRQGKSIAVPTHYYKVLLRTVAGNTGKRIEECTADELQAIGVWVANSSNSGTVSTGDLRTVEEIEELTGFTYFRNLPEEVAAQVKRQKNPSQWIGFN